MFPCLTINFKMNIHNIIELNLIKIIFKSGNDHSECKLSPSVSRAQFLRVAKFAAPLPRACQSQRHHNTPLPFYYSFPLLFFYTQAHMGDFAAIANSFVPHYYNTFDAGIASRNNLAALYVCSFTCLLSPPHLQP